MKGLERSFRPWKWKGICSLVKRVKASFIRSFRVLQRRPWKLESTHGLSETLITHFLFYPRRILIWKFSAAAGSGEACSKIGFFSRLGASNVCVCFLLWWWWSPPPSCFKGLLFVMATRFSLLGYAWKNPRTKKEKELLGFKDFDLFQFIFNPV